MENNNTDNKPIAKQFKDTTLEVVSNKLNQYKEYGLVDFPKDYSISNALRAAWFILLETKTGKDDGYKPVLEVCTNDSISNALFKMAINGLNPAKKQCYFIPYKKTLSLQISYMGNEALAKRYGGVQKITSQIVYEKDTFEFEIDLETGYQRIKKHKQTLDSISLGNIVAAYAVAFLPDGNKDIEIMTIEQIKNAWKKSLSKGSGEVHKDFSDEMAKRTVINRLCKRYINTSDDSALFDDDTSMTEIIQSTVTSEINNNANQEEIGFNEPIKIEEKPIIVESEVIEEPEDDF